MIWYCVVISCSVLWCGVLCCDMMWYQLQVVLCHVVWYHVSWYGAVSCTAVWCYIKCRSTDEIWYRYDLVLLQILLAMYQFYFLFVSYFHAHRYFYFSNNILVLHCNVYLLLRLLTTLTTADPTLPPYNVLSLIRSVKFFIFIPLLLPFHTQLFTLIHLHQYAPHTHTHQHA